MELRELLMYTIDRQASDLHLTEEMPPLIRIDGRIIPSELPVLSRDATKKLIYSVLSS